MYLRLIGPRRQKSATVAVVRAPLHLRELERCDACSSAKGMPSVEIPGTSGLEEGRLQRDVYVPATTSSMPRRTSFTKRRVPCSVIIVKVVVLEANSSRSVGSAREIEVGQIGVGGRCVGRRRVKSCVWDKRRQLRGLKEITRVRIRLIRRVRGINVGRRHADQVRSRVDGCKS